VSENCGAVAASSEEFNIGIFIFQKQNMDFSDNKKDKMKLIFLFTAIVKKRLSKKRKTILRHIDIKPHNPNPRQ
jgi:hypothetical protein